MERKHYFKFFLRCCCVSGILLGLVFPSFGWASEAESWKNLKFSVRIFSIPENFSLEQMSFSYNGLAGRGNLPGINPAEMTSRESVIPARPLVDLAEPNTLNNRIREIGAFLLQYINVDGAAHTDGQRNPGFTPPSRPKDQKISFEFESTPSNFSGAVLFTMNI
jgi:hypothetical protein